MKKSGLFKSFGEEAAAYAVKLAKTRVSDLELILTGYGIKADNIEYIVVEV